MIGPSQRRHQRERASLDWSVHRRLARGRDRNRHLLLGSVLALLTAVAAWTLGLELPVRAAAVAAAMLLAWLVPLRGSDEWALRWIGDRAGLAYQTALELDGQSDRYGLRAAVEERAQSGLGAVERPDHSAWWLPLLALAIGALLLPALPIAGGGGAGNGQLPPGSGPQAPADLPEEQGEEPAPDIPQEEQTRVARSPSEGGPEGQRGEEGETERDGQAGEREALERYLRSIRERPAELAEEPEGEGGDSGRAPGGQAREGDSEEQEGGGRRGSEQGRSGQEGEGDQQGQQPGQQGDEQSGEQGEPGQGGGDQETQNPFAQAESNESGDAGEQPGEAGEPGEGGAGEEQLQEGGQEATSDGDPQGGGDQEGQGQGAGGRPSAERPADRAGESLGETIQLQGDLRQGPTSSGGTIQLPGGDEVELPPGRTAETYTREVERAITEGRIPLEYQEIIRNYFR